MKCFALVKTLFLAAASVFAQWPEGVTVIKAEPGKTVEATGSFEAGVPIQDLSWASSSSNACFPATQFHKFAGHHVFFATEIPPRSLMTITVVPADVGQDVSLYAYEIGKTYFHVPPALPSCVTCEASHKWDRPRRFGTQDDTRSVELNAIANPYNVFIGVSGPKTATSGAFTLKIRLEPY